MNRILVLLVLAAACSDPVVPQVEEVDPCEALYACRSPGQDVAVLSVNVSGGDTDPQTGSLIVRPDSIPIRFRLRNYGTDTATAGYIYVHIDPYEASFTDSTLAFPKIAPGADYEFQGVMRFRPEYASRVLDDRVTISVDANVDGDTIWSNNSRQSQTFHLAAPLLTMTFTVTNPTVFAGDTIALRVVARNYGRHAAAPAGMLAVCLPASGGLCTSIAAPVLGWIARPMVPPGGVVTFDARVPVRPEATWQDARTSSSTYLCESDAANQDYLPPRSPCHSGSSVVIIPDYERFCQPPLLQPGVVVSMTTYNCGDRPPTPSGEAVPENYRRFHIVSLDAHAGRTYVLTRSDTSGPVRVYNAAGLLMFDMDADAERIRIGSTERIYLVMYTAGSALSVRMADSEEVS